MKTDRFFLISNPVKGHLTLRITKCEVCNQIHPTHCIVHQEGDRVGVLLVCENCYNELALYELEPKERVQEEAIMIKDASTMDEGQEQKVAMDSDSEPDNIIMDESDEIIIREEASSEGIEMEANVDTTSSQVGTTEDLLKKFIQASLSGGDPYSLLKEHGSLEPDALPQTILMLEALSSYPFPSARLNAVEVLGRILKEAKDSHHKDLVKQALTIFSNDSDPKIKELVKKLK